RRVMDAMTAAIRALDDAESARLRGLVEDVEGTERRVFAELLGGPLGKELLVLVVVGLMIRGMNRTIGVAVQRMQSSGAELHAAATQQARGAKGPPAPSPRGPSD